MRVLTSCSPALPILFNSSLSAPILVSPDFNTDSPGFNSDFLQFQLFALCDVESKTVGPSQGSPLASLGDVF